MMILRIIPLLLILAFQDLHAAEIPIIDAHSQAEHDLDLEKVIRLMDQGGVYRTILSSRRGLTLERLLSFAAKYPERIIPAVRTKGYMQLASYYELLEKQVNTGRFGAIAEVLLYHSQKRKPGDPKYAPLVVVYPDDEKVQAALQYALEKKWPFVVHIEFAAIPSSKERETFMAKLKALLRRYPQHPFVLIHMGMLELVTVRQLIEAHGNIYLIAAWTNAVAVRASRQPFTNMFNAAGTGLSADWKRLMIGHPDRFILGFDNVWTEQWGRFYLDQIALWRQAMKELPLEIAHAFAHGNAERLWHLPPIK